MDINWTDQIQLGDLTLKNRIFMAALTRQRCDPKLCIPTPLVAQYYGQRSGAGLILSEATAWSLRGRGFVGAACLYNREQMQGWKNVVDTVHDKGSRIFVQLFHCGRSSDPTKTQGLELWAPSALPVRGEKIRDLNNAPFPIPKQMTLQDIKQCQSQYEQAVKLAKQAGFDGVQVHGAHGYLVDGFLRSQSNKRTDIYGGNAQNRIRFCLQLIDITLKYFPASRIGIKISPASRIKDMYDQNPVQTYSLLLKELDQRGIGFVQIRESTQFYPCPLLYPLSQKDQMPDVCQALRPYYKGLLIGNDSFNAQTGLQKIRAGLCDAVSFGKYYISNPDLAERIINGWELNGQWDMKTFYGTQNQEKGYSDYPFYSK